MTSRSKMISRSLRVWRAVHRWTSLVCTLNLLILCATGLVLIFHHELDDLIGSEMTGGVASSAGGRLPAQQLLEIAAGSDPTLEPKLISFPADHPDEVFVRLGLPGAGDLMEGKWIKLNAATGAMATLKQPSQSVLGFIAKLHIDLFAGLPGQLFVGAMGVVFVVSTVSGVVLYGPSMAKLAFGALRFGRHPRIVHTDMHNLLGVVILAWAMVVGLTGAVLSFSPLIIGVWQNTELAALIARHPGPPSGPAVNIDQVIAAAKAGMPGKDIAFVALPATKYASDHHYAALLRGDSEVTRRLLSIALVKADDGKLDEIADTPWYVKALLLSGPFHFGDYGGLPLKILWFLFTAGLTAVTVTGLAIWLKRPRRRTDNAAARQTDLDAVLQADGAAP